MTYAINTGIDAVWLCLMLQVFDKTVHEKFMIYVFTIPDNNQKHEFDFREKPQEKHRLWNDLGW